MSYKFKINRIPFNRLGGTLGSVAFIILFSLVTYGSKKPHAILKQFEKLSDKQLDSAALSILSQMTLKEKVNEIHGKGAMPMVMGIIFKGHSLPVKAGGCRRLNIPTQLFTDGPRGDLESAVTKSPVGYV